VPCGISEPRYGVTSLADLGLTAMMPDVDLVLRREFEPLFGETAAVSFAAMRDAQISSGATVRP
jgi:lipoyl(octanoyl) transferase